MRGGGGGESPPALELLRMFPAAARVVGLAEGPPVRRLATAESCTGGLLGAVLTSRPGSSTVFVGGVVSYSNLLKETLLGVPHDLLESRGAVSAEVSVAMAIGARERLGADLGVAITGVAITGVAGPGASESKPPGLIFVSVADLDGVITERLGEDRGRAANRSSAVALALRMLESRLAG